MLMLLYVCIIIIFNLNNNNNNDNVRENNDASKGTVIFPAKKMDVIIAYDFCYNKLCTF